MVEIWKDIKGYEGVYQISNTGLVKSAWNGNHFAGYYNFRHIIKGSKSNFGYLVLNLRHPNGIDRWKVLAHRLVAEYFIENPYGRPEVDHIDTDKTNNSSDNLRWVNRSENMRNVITYRRSCLANKKNAKRGDNSPSAKRIEQISDGLSIASYESVVTAAKITGIPYKRILHCARGEQSLAGGYKWKYV